MNGAEYLLIFPGIALVFMARAARWQHRYHVELTRAGLYRTPTVEDVIDSGLVGTFEHNDAIHRRADEAVSAGGNIEMQRLKSQYDAAWRDLYVALPGSFVAVIAAVLVFPRMPSIAGVEFDGVMVIWTAFVLVVGAFGVASVIRFARRGHFVLAVGFALGVVGLVVAYAWIMSGR